MFTFSNIRGLAFLSEREAKEEEKQKSKKGCEERKDKGLRGEKGNSPRTQIVTSTRAVAYDALFAFAAEEQ